VDEVIVAVYALQQIDGVADVVGADLSLNYKTVGANEG
jgi:hypothetical protein